tara:strand:- start:489 stop:839 length:351 start_codon:yes stop_codon:yes gene_type:complete
MFVRVLLTANHEIGSVVSYSVVDNAWGLASGVNSPLGVIEEVIQDEETQLYWGRCAFAGIAYALSNRAIPDQGGELAVLNGGVYVDNTTDHAGIIAPLPRGQETREAGQLVMVHIR